MSFAGNSPGTTTAAAAATQQYFCHQCNRTVTLTPSPSSDLLCPNCDSDFLEEVQNPNPFSTVSSDLSSLFPNPQPHHEFDPYAFLHNYLNTIRNSSGSNIQFVINNSNNTTMSFGFGGDDGGGLGLGFGMPANLGDYFIGPGLEQLIQQLAENDPNRYGTPPAAKDAVEGLPTVRITEEVLGGDFSECAVCKDEFGVGDEAKEMPCKHVYHKDCILPWLEMHNSCPVCRFELPTDDPDYENRARSESGSSRGGGGGGLEENVADMSRGGQRRFSIQLPWPFRGSGEGSNSRGGGNNNNNNNNAGDSDSGPQPMEEDLD